MATGIYELTPFTMLDFQGKLSCIIWFAGCNMKCQYCHNKQIAESGGELSLEYIKEFLKSRVGKLEAVVFSGGEATLYKNLPQLADYAKSLGFATKLDTNGTNPKMVKKLVSKNLIDYIALDYKAPYHKFCEITAYRQWEKFQETLNYLTNEKPVEFEVRTTWHTALLDQQDIEEIAEDLNARDYQNSLYLQQCNPVDEENCFAKLPQSEIIKDKDLSKAKVKIEFR